MLLLVNRGKSDESKIKEKDSRDVKIYEGFFLWSGDRNRGCWNYNLPRELTPLVIAGAKMLGRKWFVNRPIRL